VDPELGEVKYQIGEGCHIDQVIGQWHAHIIELGYIFDSEKVRKALNSLFKYNFKENLRDYPNPCRVYALNDEKGIVICTWPKGGMPKVPVPYFSECMNGFEYQVACHMIYEGLMDEGLAIVKAVRERYDGERRNPWNEFECGSNYARSMASYSLLLALSGFEYDMRKGHIGFSPKINKEDKISFAVKYGHIRLKSFSCKAFKERKIQAILLGERKIPFTVEGSRVCFDLPITIERGDILTITLTDGF